MGNPFSIEVEVENGEDMAGKVRLRFNVPYMWFAFYHPLSVLGPRRLSKEERRHEAKRIAQQFGHMVAEEVFRAWPEEG